MACKAGMLLVAVNEYVFLRTPMLTSDSVYSVLRAVADREFPFAKPQQKEASCVM